MAATNYSPIQLYYSTTASAAPAAGNLVSGELAINITDGKLYYKDNAGTVQLLSTSTTANGTVNGVLYLNGSKVATSGSALTFDGTTQSSPAYQATTGAPGFSISNQGAGAARSQYTNTGGTVYIGLDNSAGGLGGAYTMNYWYTGNYAQVWAVNNAEQMRLTSTGLGIGTSSPGYKLDVRGNSVAGNGTISTALSYDTNGLVGTLSNHSLGIITNSTVVARFDTSGNLGLGVTPSASSACVNMEFGGYGATLSARNTSSAPQFALMSNAVGNWYASTYKIAGKAAMYLVQGNDGSHSWHTAGTGTAGDAITFTQAMTLDASGNLGIGTSSPQGKLHVKTGTNQNLIISSQGGNLSFEVANDAYSANTAVRYYASAHTWYAGGNNMFLDSSGNLGLGVAPSASWPAGTNAIQFGPSSALYNPGSGSRAILASNAIFTSGVSSATYITSNAAAFYDQDNGTHKWKIAPSGTAGDPITFTQAMTLDSNTYLTLNGASTDGRLQLTNTARATSDGFWVGVDSGQSYLLSRGAYPLVFYTNAAERARIDSSGNFLIGRTSSGVSGYKLQIDGSGGIASSANAAVEFGIRTPDATYNDSYLIFGTPTYNRAAIYCTGSAANTGNLVFTTYNAGSGAERARIDSIGNLLVGTTVGGQPDANAASITVGEGAFRSHHATGTASGTIHAYFTYGGLGIGSITQSGTTAVLYNVTSDQRLKENIVDAPEFGSVIDSIKVRSYDWKVDGNHQRAGFVAQELVTVAPEAVHQPADPEEMMAVDYSKLVPMLVKEIQSLRARVAQLESN